MGMSPSCHCICPGSGGVGSSSPGSVIETTPCSHTVRGFANRWYVTHTATGTSPCVPFYNATWLCDDDFVGDGCSRRTTTLKRSSRVALCPTFPGFGTIAFINAGSVGADSFIQVSVHTFANFWTFQKIYVGQKADGTASQVLDIVAPPGGDPLAVGGGFASGATVTVIPF